MNIALEGKGGREEEAGCVGIKGYTRARCNRHSGYCSVICQYQGADYQCVQGNKARGDKCTHNNQCRSSNWSCDENICGGPATKGQSANLCLASAGSPNVLCNTFETCLMGASSTYCTTVIGADQCPPSHETPVQDRWQEYKTTWTNYPVGCFCWQLHNKCRFNSRVHTQSTIWSGGREDAYMVCWANPTSGSGGAVAVATLPLRSESHNTLFFLF